jgi:hypothetical protein
VEFSFEELVDIIPVPVERNCQRESENASSALFGKKYSYFLEFLPILDLSLKSKRTQVQAFTIKILHILSL